MPGDPLPEPSATATRPPWPSSGTGASPIGRSSARSVPTNSTRLILGRLQFDAEGLILAEDDGRLAGFVHAAFGPESAVGPSHQIDRSMGTVAMLVVDPKRDDPALELALFDQAEAYLKSRGAKVLYAGVSSS